jgi:hypothetical protein
MPRPALTDDAGGRPERLVVRMWKNVEKGGHQSRNRCWCGEELRKLLQERSA